MREKKTKLIYENLNYWLKHTIEKLLKFIYCINGLARVTGKAKQRELVERPAPPTVLDTIRTTAWNGVANGLGSKIETHKPSKSKRDRFASAIYHGTWTSI